MISSSQSKTVKTPPSTQTTILTTTTKIITQTQGVENVENDFEKENDKKESKDDWVINDNDDVNENDIIVPSFIRLFVIRRTIDKYIKNNKDMKTKTKEEIIKEMAIVFKDNEKYESLVITILTRLINNGIKEYMNKYYNEKEESNIIENIFNKIILEKFSQEYNVITKYGINNEEKNDNYYQNLLFNLSDLMNQIFQYLEWGKGFDGDLYECSLVSSHWLYHVWNVNSVYYINFDLLVEHAIDNNRKWSRIWQRLYNVKYIEFTIITLSQDDSKVVATVNKLSMLRKVEKVNVVVMGQREVNKAISYVIPILSRCKDRIKDCRIHIVDFWNSSNFEAPSPLRLPKAQYVDIGDLFFRRVWTNECTHLKLSGVDNINKDWCEFVIANCNCSNISSLVLNSVTFDNNSMNKVILKQFALKFDNLKTLEIEMDEMFDDHDNVLLFVQLLKPIISKNKTKVELKVDAEDARFLSQRMHEKDLKINCNIDKLIIGNGDTFGGKNFDDAIKLIQERDNCGLTHLAIECRISGREGKELLDKLKCKSITTFELKSSDVDNLDFVNPLLEWKMIAQKQIFVIIDVFGYDWKYGNINSDQVLSLFKQLCQNVCQLFVQQIALDVKVTFGVIKDSKEFNLYLSIYSSYFDNLQFLSKYNKPKCHNNFRLPRDKPYTYFYINDSKKTHRQRYCVFGATNVQNK